MIKTNIQLRRELADMKRDKDRAIELAEQSLAKATKLLKDVNDLRVENMKLATLLTKARMEATIAQAGSNLRARSLQFDNDDIKRLIRLCHPDKHGNSETANIMTKKLLNMRGEA